MVKILNKSSPEVRMNNVKDKIIVENDQKKLV